MELEGVTKQAESPLCGESGGGDDDGGIPSSPEDEDPDGDLSDSSSMPSPTSSPPPSLPLDTGPSSPSPSGTGLPGDLAAAKPPPLQQPSGGLDSALPPPLDPATPGETRAGAETKPSLPAAVSSEEAERLLGDEAWVAQQLARLDVCARIR